MTSNSYLQVRDKARLNGVVGLRIRSRKESPAQLGPDEDGLFHHVLLLTFYFVLTIHLNKATDKQRDSFSLNFSVTKIRESESHALLSV